MSTGSESFTSDESGSIENRLDRALETGAPQESADDDRHRYLSGGFKQSVGRSSQSDEEEFGGAEPNGSFEPGFQEPGKAAAEQSESNVRAAAAAANNQPDSLASSQAAADWSVNSPRLDSMPESGREFDFRSLSRQLCKKSARRGFDFKLMLVGESGVGKTTLIDSLFNVDSTRNLGSQFVSDFQLQTSGSVASSGSTTRLCERYYQLEEGGVSVRLTVIDTPGFAGELDSRECVQPVLGYLEKQLDSYYRQEQGTDRSKLQDGRVHALVYLINPSNRSLKPLDLMCLKALQGKVNILPVIAKADTLTTSEKSALKSAVLRDLERHRIGVYELPEFQDRFPPLPDQTTGDEYYLRNQYEALKTSMPLAVVGSDVQVQDSNGQWIRAREYPWGIVDIDNPEYSDFLKLRELLVMYMEDLKDKTHEVIYEQIRLNKLRQTDRQMSRMSESLVETERLLRAKDEELQRLRAEVAAAKSSSLPGPSSSQSYAPPGAAAAAGSSYSGGPLYGMARYSTGSAGYQHQHQHQHQQIPGATRVRTSDKIL